MRSRKLVMAALGAGALLLAPGAAEAWVAMRVGFPVARGAAVGIAAGAVAGAAVASAYDEPDTVIVNPAPAAPAAAAPPPAQPVPAAPAVGTMVTTLPPGCAASGSRYQCGSVWYQEYFGGNGVYYQVVAP